MLATSQHHQEATTFKHLTPTAEHQVETVPIDDQKTLELLDAQHKQHFTTASKQQFSTSQHTAPPKPLRLFQTNNNSINATINSSTINNSNNTIINNNIINNITNKKINNNQFLNSGDSLYKNVIENDYDSLCNNSNIQQKNEVLSLNQEQQQLSKQQLTNRTQETPNPRKTISLLYIASHKMNQNKKQHQKLHQLLVAAELQQYTQLLATQLNVKTVKQLKLVADEDLLSLLQMSMPEVRRLRSFQRKMNQGTFHKLKNMLSRHTQEQKQANIPKDFCCIPSSSYSPIRSIHLPHITSHDEKEMSAMTDVADERLPLKTQPSKTTSATSQDSFNNTVTQNFNGHTNELYFNNNNNNNNKSSILRINVNPSLELCDLITSNAIKRRSEDDSLNNNNNINNNNNNINFDGKNNKNINVINKNNNNRNSDEMGDSFETSLSPNISRVNNLKKSKSNNNNNNNNNKENKKGANLTNVAFTTSTYSFNSVMGVSRVVSIISSDTLTDVSSLPGDYISDDDGACDNCYIDEAADLTDEDEDATFNMSERVSVSSGHTHHSPSQPTTLDFTTSLYEDVMKTLQASDNNNNKNNNDHNKNNKTSKKNHTEDCEKKNKIKVTRISGTVDKDCAKNDDEGGIDADAKNIIHPSNQNAYVKSNNIANKLSNQKTDKESNNNAGDQSWVNEDGGADDLLRKKKKKKVDGNTQQYSYYNDPHLQAKKDHKTMKQSGTTTNSAFFYSNYSGDDDGASNHFNLSVFNKGTNIKKNTNSKSMPNPLKIRRKSSLALLNVFANKSNNNKKNKSDNKNNNSMPSFNANEMFFMKLKEQETMEKQDDRSAEVTQAAEFNNNNNSNKTKTDNMSENHNSNNTSTNDDDDDTTPKITSNFPDVLKTFDRWQIGDGDEIDRDSSIINRLDVEYGGWGYRNSSSGNDSNNNSNRIINNNENNYDVVENNDNNDVNINELVFNDNIVINKKSFINQSNMLNKSEEDGEFKNSDELIRNNNENDNNNNNSGNSKNDTYVGNCTDNNYFCKRWSIGSESPEVVDV